MAMADDSKIQIFITGDRNKAIEAFEGTQEPRDLFINLTQSSFRIIGLYVPQQFQGVFAEPSVAVNFGALMEEARLDGGKFEIILIAEKDALIAEITQSKDYITRLEKSCTVLICVLAAELAKSEEMNSTLGELHARIDALMSENSAKATELANGITHSNFAMLQDRCTVLTRAVAAEEAESGKTAKRVASLEDSIAALTSANDAVEEKMAGRIAALEEEKVAGRIEKEDMAGRIAALVKEKMAERIVALEGWDRVVVQFLGVIWGILTFCFVGSFLVSTK